MHVCIINLCSLQHEAGVCTLHISYTQLIWHISNNITLIITKLYTVLGSLEIRLSVVTTQSRFWLCLLPWLVGRGWGLSYGGGHLQPCGRVLSYIYGHHRGCLNNPIFSNLGLCAACWACLICHHELWPTSASHLFSSLNSSLGFAGGKHNKKITIPIFRLVLRNFAIPGYFPYTCILFYSCLFSLLSSGWFVIAVCGSISVQGAS